MNGIFSLNTIVNRSDYMIYFVIGVTAAIIAVVMWILCRGGRDKED